MIGKHLLPAAETEKQNESTKKVRAWNDRHAEETGKRRRAYVLTLGCQQNEADSEKIAGMLCAMGYEMTRDENEASFLAVNTCAVREHAEKRALSFIGQYKHLKAKDPEVIIAVFGCMVAQEHRAEAIKKSNPYVDLVFGTSSLYRLPELLLDHLERGKRLFCTGETEYTVAEGIPVRRESTYRAWVSVMYGCDNFCSYCIVPYVRGRERSREKSEIIKEVRELVNAGYRDITLLGQNVNSYGRTDGFPYDFADLLEELDRIEGDYLIRFMTSHPKDASHKLIDVMATSKHIAHQFHLPLQSGSDRLLRVMNRHYDLAKYFDSLDYIKKKMPDCALSTDIIVGFPGETEEDFSATLAALGRARYDMIFSFLYSPRKGTPAAEMEDQIPEAVKSERYGRMLKLQNAISSEKNQPLVGKTVRILSDGISKNNDEVCSGRTEGNKIVFYHGAGSDAGKWLFVRIDRAEAFALYGEVVPDGEIV